MTANLFEALSRKPLKVVLKDWGKEVWFANDEKNNYCGKILEVRKGEGFKMHFHIIKCETFYIISGKLRVVLIDTTDRSLHTGTLNQGDCLDLERFVPHAVEALEDCVIIEASTFHRDSDSFRI